MTLYAPICAKHFPATWFPFRMAQYRKKKHAVFLDLLGFYSVVVWYCDTNLIKSSRTFCCIFQYQPVVTGNQHGGREYDDLQYWLI